MNNFFVTVFLAFFAYGLVSFIFDVVGIVKKKRRASRSFIRHRRRHLVNAVLKGDKKAILKALSAGANINHVYYVDDEHSYFSAELVQRLSAEGCREVTVLDVAPNNSIRLFLIDNGAKPAEEIA